MAKQFFSYWIVTLICLPVSAGFFEISALGSYRKNTVSSSSETITQSITGSISYYFMEMSALELSYTQGNYELKGTGLVGSRVVELIQITTFNIYGADLVFTLSDRKAPLQPYVKLGLARRVQDIDIEQDGNKTNFDQSEGSYLSYGAGFKILLTDSISFKFGYASFKGPLGKDSQSTDASFRGGLSWFF